MADVHDLLDEMMKRGRSVDAPAESVDRPIEYADESLALRYREHRFSRDAVKVLPGGYAVDADGLLMVTTLGSCVAAGALRL